MLDIFVAFTCLIGVAYGIVKGLRALDEQENKSGN